MNHGTAAQFVLVDRQSGAVDSYPSNNELFIRTLSFLTKDQVFSEFMAMVKQDLVNLSITQVQTLNSIVNKDLDRRALQRLKGNEQKDKK